MANDLLHPRFPGDLHEEGVVQVGLPVAVGEVRDELVRQMLMGFESLGEDCEFGLVQRRYAAEPLSLFRWTTTPPDALLRLLDTRLDRFGEPANTEIRVAPWGELMAFDLAHDMKMHTFVHKSGVDVERFAVNQCRRMRFLKQKLLEDLALHEKIFVFQAGPLMTDELARALAVALRKYGRTMLLAVGLSSGLHSDGTVVDEGNGLLRGYLGRRGKTAAPGGGHRWNIDFDGWIALCRRSLELVANGRDR